MKKHPFKAWSAALLLFWQLPVAVAADTTGVRFSYLETSQSQGAQEAMVVAGGSWWIRRHLTHGALLIEHAKGTLLFDTGLGTQVDQQFAENSWLSSQLFAYTEPDPVVNQLSRHQYSLERITAIIPSHLHWDHASGLVDFPGIPIWVQQGELEAARHGEKPSFLQSQLSSPELNWRLIKLTSVPFLGFEHSLDVFGDGSVVLVDLAGHTTGQVGLYLRTYSGMPYLFIGDTTWTLEGVTTNQPRPDLIKLVVDLEQDEDLAKKRIGMVHQLAADHPEITIVPAHDEHVAATLPHFPDFSEADLVSQAN